MKFSWIKICVLLFIAGCEQEEAEQKLTLPSNLVLSVTVAENGSGKVDVTADADMVNYYTIVFDDNGTLVPTKTTDGKASYTFENSGIYRVSANAHVTQAEYISESTIFEVKLAIDEPVPTDGATSPLTYPGKTLAWQDEFDGNSLNTSNWKFELGAGGWGNNELQFYREENTSVNNGLLTITAKKETYQGSDYTSSRIVTADKKLFKYGRVDIRAKLPEGQGIWPALWMLGSNISTVGWPKCGEIDIMEMVGGSGRENTVLGTAHWDNNGTYASYSGNKSISSGKLGDEFHVYSIEWTGSSIIWYLDNIEYHIIDITPADLSEFQNEFFFIFNVAVGGNLPGNPDGTSTYPQSMVVDYVRVFSNN